LISICASAPINVQQNTSAMDFQDLPRDGAAVEARAVALKRSPFDTLMITTLGAPPSCVTMKLCGRGQ
jgi:hypothetical protein